MFKCVSSEPEARRWPDLDQLRVMSAANEGPERESRCQPQRINTSCMTAKLIDDVKLIHPVPVAIQGLDRSVAPLLPNLPTQQRNVEARACHACQCGRRKGQYGVLHAWESRPGGREGGNRIWVVDWYSRSWLCKVELS
jgi:hypothetical protein